MIKKLFFLLMTILLIVTLSACKSVSVNVLVRGITAHDSMKYDYQLFNGNQSQFRAYQENETLTLIINAKVKQGLLEFSVLDEDRNKIWSLETNENLHQEVKITIPDDGRYRINVAGENTKGGFDIQW